MFTTRTAVCHEQCSFKLPDGVGGWKVRLLVSGAKSSASVRNGWSRFEGAHLDTTTNRRSSAKRIAAFTLQHGAMLTPRQPEGCVPVVVSRCARFEVKSVLDHEEILIQ